MATLSLQTDACQVLGVAPNATLQEIRDAYRAQAKRYHPDAGGEEWAFRLIAQAYELLSTERVRRANAQEAESNAARAGARARAAHRAPGAAAGPHPWEHAQPPPHQARPASTPPPRAARPANDPHAPRETVRPGVQEDAPNTERVVDVEKLMLRYQADHVWLITDQARDDRLISCSLNLAWPAPSVTTPPAEIDGHETILRGLRAALAAVAGPGGGDEAPRSTVVDGRFTGWLSFPNGDQANAAFERLRDELHKAGLSVKQWTRELFIPRAR